MHQPLPVERGAHENPSTASDVLSAVQRMAELVLLAARNLVAAHELSRREANGIALEVETLRCSLEVLRVTPKNSAAAAHVALVLPKLDDMMSLQLWALNSAAAAEWRSCRALVLRASQSARSWTDRLLHARPLLVDETRDLESVRDLLPAALRTAAEEAHARRR